MPITGEPPDLLGDTSVAVPLVATEHGHHRVTIRAVSGQRLGPAGHAAFETFSVLTRLPPPTRLTPAAASRAIEVNFPGSRPVAPATADALLKDLVMAGIAGGAVYDALVGATAREHGITLCTRDRRAVETYRALGVPFDLLTAE